MCKKECKYPRCIRSKQRFFCALTSCVEQHVSSAPVAPVRMAFRGSDRTAPQDYGFHVHDSSLLNNSGGYRASGPRAAQALGSAQVSMLSMRFVEAESARFPCPTTQAVAHELVCTFEALFESQNHSQNSIQRTKRARPLQLKGRCPP